jgi:hypothetical protein
LGDASEQDVEDYLEALQKKRAETGAELQTTVYQNRTQFIKISKEAEKLKGEMRALKNLMSELKTNTTALRYVSSQGAEVNGFDQDFPTTLSKKDRRSSVADRTAMWNSQLQVGSKKICLILRCSNSLGLMEKRRRLPEVLASPSRSTCGSKCWSVD